ncbi:uncharacterized protein LOC118484116 [Helianthus annuus]|uniref:uncharacterized protein LOC118484116 n=1 Tax=Helianthus annuus TaxID=4232 RepID=UPI001653355C|nr:uncharacterized protein LOC118484116 [Helianthus annuus]
METRTNTRLDNQDAQIKQLQTNVADIRNSIQALDVDGAESSEFQKVVLAWMSRQEKKSMSDSSGSGASGGDLTFSGFRSGSGPSDTSDSVSPLPWAVKKVDFQTELLQRFSGLEIQNPYEQLATIKQGDSIYDYIDDFEYFLSLVPRLPESQSIGYFIAGLKDDVKKCVRLHRPQSPLDAKYLAKDVELMLHPSSGHSSLGRFQYLNPTGNPTFGLKDGPQLLGRSEYRPFFSSKVSERVSSPKSESSRSVLNPKLSFPITDCGPSSTRDRGVRSLSRTEWEDRRKKGLCFRCGQQYGPTHKCPEGKLCVLLLGDDKDDTSQGEKCLLQSASSSASDSDMDGALGTCNA